jgi:hypothetical protein
MLRKADVARELLRRKRCQESLHSFALNIQMPTVPNAPMYPDEDLLGPAENFMSRHHAVLLSCIQRTMTRPMGRALIMLPPGSAKSLYTDCVGTTWYMGKFPGSRLMLTSYQGDLAERQSSRAQFIVEQDDYRLIFGDQAKLAKDAKKDWLLENGSNMLAMGLTGGLTGNRANGWIIDDPLSGRKEADSETQRQDCYNAYKDDLLTRSLPNAWGIIVLTRWHEDDIAGRILPDDYDGRSGIVRCKDGLDWDILNIPAKCERSDDPLGRQIGEYIWPEYYPPEHWAMFENAQGSESARTWSSLYQQRPTPQGSDRFAESMFDFYKEGTQPPFMAYIGAGDYAVTEGRNDFTELGVFGVDPSGDLWEVDWWHKQANTAVTCEQTIELIKKWKIPMWFNEGGVIDKAMGPLFNLRLRQRNQAGENIYVDRRAITSMQDKLAKCASFQGRAASGGESGLVGPQGEKLWRTGSVHFRDNANSRRIVQQLVALPAGRYDDAADVCGLVGRAMDQFPVGRVPVNAVRTPGPVFGSVEWLEWREEEKPKIRYR